MLLVDLLLMGVVHDVYAGLLANQPAVLDSDRVVDVGEGDGVDGRAVGASIFGPDPVEDRPYAG